MPNCTRQSFLYRKLKIRVCCRFKAETTQVNTMNFYFHVKKEMYKAQPHTLKRAAMLLCFICFAFTAAPKLAAETPTGGSDTAAIPYTDDEFPLWAHELRRFEILSFGALPLVTMLSFWTYDIARSIRHSGDERYYPWPLKKSETAIPISSDAQKKIFFTAVGISVGIALTDICIRAIIRSVREKKMLKENILQDDSIQLEPLEE